MTTPLAADKVLVDLANCWTTALPDLTPNMVKGIRDSARGIFDGYQDEVIGAPFVAGFVAGACAESSVREQFGGGLAAMMSHLTGGPGIETQIATLTGCCMAAMILEGEA